MIQKKNHLADYKGLTFLDSGWGESDFSNI